MDVLKIVRFIYSSVRVGANNFYPISYWAISISKGDFHLQRISQQSEWAHTDLSFLVLRFFLPSFETKSIPINHYTFNINRISKYCILQTLYVYSVLSTCCELSMFLNIKQWSSYTHRSYCGKYRLGVINAVRSVKKKIGISTYEKTGKILFWPFTARGVCSWFSIK